MRYKNFQNREPSPWWVLTLLCTSFFMVVTDSTSVYSALPSIEKELDFSIGGSEWIIIIYALVFAGLVLLGGRISDYFGRKRMFVIGVILFTSSAALCGFSWTGEILILARLIQGIAAALMTPAALSIVINTFKEEKDKNKAIGIWGAMGGIGATGGLVIGGPTTVWLGWEWIFFINVPLGLLILVLTPFFLKESSDRTITDFDIPGAVLITCFLLAITYLITGIPSHGWSSNHSIFLFAASIILFLLFLWIERRAQNPLVPFRIFNSRTLVGGNLLIILAGMSVDGMLYIFTLFAQQLLGFSALQFGLTMTAMTVLSVVGVYIGQYFVSRFGLIQVGVIGMAFLGTGMAILNFNLGNQNIWGILTALSIFGIGMGAAFVTAQIAALSNIKEKDSGLASGIIETSFSIGGAMGIAILATVSQLFSRNTNIQILTIAGVRNAFSLVVIFAVIGIGISLFYFRKPSPA